MTRGLLAVGAALLIGVALRVYWPPPRVVVKASYAAIRSKHEASATVRVLFSLARLCTGDMAHSACTTATARAAGATADAAAFVSTVMSILNSGGAQPAGEPYEVGPDEALALKRVVAVLRGAGDRSQGNPGAQPVTSTVLEALARIARLCLLDDIRFLPAAELAVEGFRRLASTEPGEAAACQTALAPPAAQEMPWTFRLHSPRIGGAG